MTDEYLKISLKIPQQAAKLASILSEKGINYDYSSKYQIIRSRKITPRTKIIPRIALIFGLLTFSGIILFQIWSGSHYYRLNTGNKPFFSIITALPYAFEISLLAAAVSAFVTFFILSGKNKIHTPIKDCAVFIFEQKDAQNIRDLCKTHNIEYDINE